MMDPRCSGTEAVRPANDRGIRGDSRPLGSAASGELTAGGPIYKMIMGNVASGSGSVFLADTSARLYNLTPAAGFQLSGTSSAETLSYVEKWLCSRALGSAETLSYVEKWFCSRVLGSAETLSYVEKWFCSRALGSAETLSYVEKWFCSRALPSAETLSYVEKWFCSRALPSAETLSYVEKWFCSRALPSAETLSYMKKWFCSQAYGSAETLSYVEKRFCSQALPSAETLSYVEKRISVLRNSTLRIVNSSRADEGSYTCRAENHFGTAEMAVLLSVKGLGRPVETQSSTSDLMIRSILLKHAGKYGCQAQTSADTVYAEAELQVRGPPGPPGVVIVEEITDTTATLSWSRGVDNHSPISTYNLQARSPFSLGWQTVRTDPEPVTGDMESAMAVHLNPWVEYEFRVVATNAIGTGDPSVPSRVVRTKEAVPSVAPVNVSGGSGRRHELVISWEPVSEEFQNGQGFGYIVAFRANGTRGWKEKMDMEQEESGEKMKTPGNETSLLLSGLEGNTLYHITVKGYNNIGQGPPSSVVRATTKKSPPSQPPSNLTWIQEGDNVSLGWEPVKSLENESHVMGYKVVLRQEGRSHSQVIETRSPSAVLSLTEGGTYLIDVRAISEGGEGTTSSEIRVLISSGKRGPCHPKICVRAKSGQLSAHSGQSDAIWTVLLLATLVPIAP
ncbi:hypothetical protein JZ751_016547, partial [Albula glossodonta]